MSPEKEYRKHMGFCMEVYTHKIPYLECINTRRYTMYFSTWFLLLYAVFYRVYRVKYRPLLPSVCLYMYIHVSCWYCIVPTKCPWVLVIHSQNRVWARTRNQLNLHRTPPSHGIFKNGGGHLMTQLMTWTHQKKVFVPSSKTLASRGGVAEGGGVSGGVAGGVAERGSRTKEAVELLAWEALELCLRGMSCRRGGGEGRREGGRTRGKEGGRKEGGYVYVPQICLPAHMSRP